MTFGTIAFGTFEIFVCETNHFDLKKFFVKKAVIKFDPSI